MNNPFSAGIAVVVLLTGTAMARPTADEFRHKAMASDAFEIASSKMALGLSQNAEVKAFAKMMIRDHTLTTEHLLPGSGMTKAEIEKKSVPGTDGKYDANDLVDQSHADMLTTLGSKKGKDFDSDYMSDQVSGHKDAVSMFEDYARHGDRKSMKLWARKTLPTLRMHLAKAETIDKAM